MKQPAKLVLADGRVFSGVAIGGAATTTGEVVFTTGMTGYQEVLTDPSYAGQLVTMTAPEIGNTGVNDEDVETHTPRVAGFIVHQLSSVVSNWRAQRSLDDYLKSHAITGIAGIDTRALTRHIRDRGAQMAAIGVEDEKTLHDRAVAATPMTGLNLADAVSTAEPYTWSTGSGAWSHAAQRTPLFARAPEDALLLAHAPSGALRPARAPEGALFGARAPEGALRPRERHVVAVDFGIKLNILRCLVDAGCRVTVVPSKARANEILALGPDGVFLSNGPGDPAAVTQGIATIRELLGKKPIFGICLGHQLLSLALGGDTYKLKFGHRGLNQPVKDLTTGRIEVTTQNHGFCVDEGSLKGKATLSHVHLNDGTCEGIEHTETGAFSVQYHPEASAGTHDANYLFQRFIDRIDRQL